MAARSRWTQVFAAVFAVLALAVAGSGYVLSGGHGVQDFARTAVSLIQLVVLLVPVTALLLGVLTLAGDRGSTELLFAQPVSRGRILVGRMTGLWLALASAEAIGFGASGLLIFARTDAEGLAGFVCVALGALALTGVFVGIAAVLAVGSGVRRSRALALALVTWFALVVVFDIGALGIASLLPSGAASRVLIVSALINPVDAVRTGALLASQGTAAFGTASLALLRFTNGPTGVASAVAASVVAWILLPVCGAVWRLKRADL